MIKKLLSAIIASIPLICSAQSPSFKSFDQTYFTTNGLIVSSRGAVTNYTFQQFGITNKATWVTRCLMTSGSPTLNSVNGVFTPADVGKGISVYFAGGNNQNLFSTIQTYVSPTQVILANNALATPVGTGGGTPGISAVYGFDNSVGFSNMLQLVSSGGGRVLGIPGTFMLNRVVGDVGNQTNHHNAQFWLPAVAPSGSTFEPNLEIDGNPSSQWTGGGGAVNPYDITPPSDATVFFSGVPSAPNNTAGVYPYKTQPFGQSVLDTRNFVNPYWFSTVGNSTWGSTAGMQFPMNAVKLLLNNLTFMQGFDANMAVLNLMGCDKAGGNHVTVTTAMPFGIQPAPTTTNSYGVIGTGNFANIYCRFDDLSVQGFYNGIDLGFMQGFSYYIVQCVRGLTVMFTGSADANMMDVTLQSCPTNFYALPGVNKATISMNVYAQNSTILSAVWYATNQVFIDDAADVFNGQVWYNYNYGASSVYTNYFFDDLTLNDVQTAASGMIHHSVERFVRGTQLFGNPLLRGTNIIIGGSDLTNATTVVGGQQKYVGLGYYNWDGNISYWVGLWPRFSTITTLIFGGAGSSNPLGASTGVQQMEWDTGAYPNSSSKLFLDSSGDLYPDAGFDSIIQTLGLTGTRWSTGFFTNVDIASGGNLIFAATDSAPVSVVTVGYKQVTIGGVTYKIALTR